MNSCKQLPSPKNTTSQPTSFNVQSLTFRPAGPGRPWCTKPSPGGGLTSRLKPLRTQATGHGAHPSVIPGHCDRRIRWYTGFEDARAPMFSGNLLLVFFHPHPEPLKVLTLDRIHPLEPQAPASIATAAGVVVLVVGVVVVV